MESIKELYRIGYGPSSSHTMGPRYAAQRFLGDFPHASHYEADLFGSLAATGKGHLTDSTLRTIFGDAGKDLHIHWFPEQFKAYHPNALSLRALDTQGNKLAERTYYSVGGGKVIEEGDFASSRPSV